LSLSRTLFIKDIFPQRAPDFIPGQVPTNFGDGISGPSGAVGAPRTAFNTRQLQLAAKFTF
jgi:hypothetical protein